MTKEELFQVMSANPAFHLATVENGAPRVRGMFLFRADSNGILFHTGTMKDIYAQLVANPAAELCFNDYKAGIQVRVRGTLELVDDQNLKEEIAAHPTRAFLKPWLQSKGPEKFYRELAVFRLLNGSACAWTMQTNYDPKVFVVL